MVQSFDGIFAEKLDRVKNKLKKHLSEVKNKRNKELIKSLLVEAKHLKGILKKYVINVKHTCPNCKHVF